MPNPSKVGRVARYLVCRGSTIVAVGLLLVLVALLTLGPNPAEAQSATPLRLIESDSSHVVLELNLSGYESRQQIADGQKYTAVSVNGLGYTGEVGKPQLPLQGAMIGIPPGAQPSLKVLIDNSRQDQLASPPLPVPTAKADINPRVRLGSQISQSYSKDQAAYSANSLYPAAPARIASTGDWRSQHYALVELYPIQYNPNGQQLLFHQRLRIEITFGYPAGLRSETLGEAVSEGPFENVLQRAVANYDTAKNWRRKSGTAARSAMTLPASSGAEWYRIGVNTDGIYRVTCGQIANAHGGPLSINRDTLRLVKQWVNSTPTELAIRVVGDTWSSCGAGESSNYIEFFGQAVKSKYTSTNAYWLTYGATNGKRMAVGGEGPSGPDPLVFTDTLHIEQDRWYDGYYPRTEGLDHWVWNYVANDWGAPYQDYPPFSLDRLAVGGSYSPTIQISLVGSSEDAHHTQISINGHVIDDAIWSGPVERRATIAFPAVSLSVGSNTIRVSEPTNLDPYDAIFVNSFDLSYQSVFQAGNDVLRFRQADSGTFQYRIPGFTDSAIEAFDITDPYNVRRMATAITSPDYALLFNDSISSPHEYLALTSAQVKTLSSIAQVAPADLLAPTNKADYIIIAPKDFKNLQSLANLAILRSSQGLRVRTVDIQDIYDEFNDGVIDPKAIRDFLFFAYNSWNQPRSSDVAPSFVLLVGDGTFDPKRNCATTCDDGTQTPENSTLIPAYLRVVDPWIGETASDNRFVSFHDGDSPPNNLPNMAIGRLPANRAEDVDAMVSKILSYEQVPPSAEWRNRVTFVADNAYSSSGVADDAGNFWIYSDQIAGERRYLPGPLVGTRIYYNPCPQNKPGCNYTPTNSISSINSAIISALNSGSLITSYVGHGQFQKWAAESLFSDYDLGMLTNEMRLTVSVEMTCYTGYFQIPNSDWQSLAESSVRIPGKGAVASWAATGLGVSAGHDLLEKGFFDAITWQAIRQLGPATVAGKTFLLMNGGGSHRDLIDTFTLFGDPASRLAIPSVGDLNLPFIAR